MIEESSASKSDEIAPKADRKRRMTIKQIRRNSKMPYDVTQGEDGERPKHRKIGSQHL